MESQVNIKKTEEKGSTTDFVSIIISCLMFLFNIILKPISTLKSRVQDFSDVKKTSILVILVSFIRMILNLFSSIISAIFTKEIVNYWTGDSKLKISFSNLKNLNYFSLIFKQFFGFILVVIIIAGIYYIVSMLMKKKINYFKVASITSVSFITYIIVSYFISPIVNYIYSPFSIFLVFGSLIYSFITFILAINEEVNFKESNYSVYFHTICLTVVVIVTYYIFKDSFSILSFL